MENVRLCPEGVIAGSAVFVTIVDVTCQDIGDDSSVLARAAGFSVADVGQSGGGLGVLDEDCAIEVGPGDLVTGDDDQDLFETASTIDLVVDCAQGERAGAGQRRDVGRPVTDVLRHNT